MCLLLGWLHYLCLLWPFALPGLWAVSWYVCFRPVCGLCGLVGGFVVLVVAWPYIYRGGAVRFFNFLELVRALGPCILWLGSALLETNSYLSKKKKKKSPLQKRIADLEFVVQRLQKQIAFNDDPMATKTFMEGEGDESFDEGTVPPSQVRNYLRRKNPKDKHSREYDYGGRYEDRYRDDDYYEKRNNDESSRFNPKFDIPEFEGRMHADDFLDWLNTVERVFEYYDPLERQKVKLVAIKMRKNASFWWENLKRQRQRDDKKKIETWEKMKKELKRKYLPFHYRQDIFLKIQNLKQQNLTVEEYSAEFENLIIKGDLQEAEEQSIARYLSGLRFEISKTVQLQPYNTLQDVIKLALKVEALNKYGGFTTNRIKEGFIKNSTSRGPSSAKTTLKPQVKGEVHKPQQESTSKSRQCFKCHGFGHIASECPNRRVVALVEEYEAEEEEDVEEAIEFDHEDKDELTMPDHGTSLVVQRSLKIGAAASEENLLRSNVFHTRCTSKDRSVWLLLIVGASRIVFPLRWCKSLV